MKLKQIFLFLPIIYCFNSFAAPSLCSNLFLKSSTQLNSDLFVELQNRASSETLSSKVLEILRLLKTTNLVKLQSQFPIFNTNFTYFSWANQFAAMNLVGKGFTQYGLDEVNAKRVIHFRRNDNGQLTHRHLREDTLFADIFYNGRQVDMSEALSYIKFEVKPVPDYYFKPDYEERRLELQASNKSWEEAYLELNRIAWVRTLNDLLSEGPQAFTTRTSSVKYLQQFAIASKNEEVIQLTTFLLRSIGKQLNKSELELRFTFDRMSVADKLAYIEKLHSRPMEFHEQMEPVLTQLEFIIRSNTQNRFELSDSVEKLFNKFLKSPTLLPHTGLSNFLLPLSLNFNDKTLIKKTYILLLKTRVAGYSFANREIANFYMKHHYILDSDWGVKEAEEIFGTAMM